jgi:hypothetical protein
MIQKALMTLIFVTFTTVAVAQERRPPTDFEKVCSGFFQNQLPGILMTQEWWRERSIFLQQENLEREAEIESLKRRIKLLRRRLRRQRRLCGGEQYSGNS